MIERLVSVDKVSFRYESDWVLEDVSLTINSQDFLAFIGPNGGGKTTLLKLILGLLKPEKGSIVFNTKRSFGYLPQVLKVDRSFPMSVTDLVLSGMMNSSLFFRASASDKRKVTAILDEFGLSDLRNKAIADISGGQLQKAMLARAIISNPKLLMLDEPNTFLDPLFSAEMYQLLTELNKRMAIVLVSHDIGTISPHIKSIACVNRSLHYHNDNKISSDVMADYQCPVELITHGHVPHRVLKDH